MRRSVSVVVLGLAVGFGAGAYPKTAPEPVEHSGCCSHHRGVCGCSADGRHAVCCDGAQSPSCGCDGALIRCFSHPRGRRRRLRLLRGTRSASACCRAASFRPAAHLPPYRREVEMSRDRGSKLAHPGGDHPSVRRTDRRDWAAVRRCFAPAVLFDMTSVGGEAPATLTPKDHRRLGDRPGADRAAPPPGRQLPDRRHRRRRHRLLLRRRLPLQEDLLRAKRPDVRRQLRLRAATAAGRWVISAFRFNLKFS